MKFSMESMIGMTNLGKHPTPLLFNLVKLLHLTSNISLPTTLTIYKFKAKPQANLLLTTTPLNQCKVQQKVQHILFWNINQILATLILPMET